MFQVLQFVIKFELKNALHELKDEIFSKGQFSPSNILEYITIKLVKRVRPNVRL